MPPAVVVAGLGCGVVLAVGAAVARGRACPIAGLPQALRILSWLAGALLVIAAAVSWLQSPPLPTLASKLFLVAAIVSPRIRRPRGSAPVVEAVLAGAVLILGGSGLYHAWLPTGRELARSIGGTQPAIARLAALALTLLAGLGTRYAGEAVGRGVVPSRECARPPAAIYGPLTLVAAIVALPRLWAQGTLGAGSPIHVGVGAAFVAWSAVWLFPRARRASYAALVSGAALLLLWVALAIV